MTRGRGAAPREVLISIPTALAGCDDEVAEVYDLSSISIPTALAGCDYQGQGTFDVDLPISIPTALAGCDLLGVSRGRVSTLVFQSPQPSRAVTAR